MTYRSRSGGPKKHAGKPAHGTGKKKGPKLHHKPLDVVADAAEDKSDTEEAKANTPLDEDEEDDADDTAVPPSSFFMTTPTNVEMLNVLKWALLDTLNSDDFPALVQRAKSLLFERKWLELFTDPSLLDAYAGRWVPSRALCFRDLMAGIKDVRSVFAPAGAGSRSGRSEGEDEGEGEEGEEREEGAEEDEEDGKASQADAEEKDDTEGNGTSENEPTNEPLHILSLGGGAGSELLAVAALASHGARVRWTGVDVGKWGGICQRIEVAARDKWKLDSTFEFVEADLLAPAKPAPKAEAPTLAETEGVEACCSSSSTSFKSSSTSSSSSSTTPAFTLPALAHLPAPHLTTLFFTLTELLSQNRARTVALLREITAATPRGGLLLVADSASDIAEFPLGKDGRTWPVYMVLDAIIKAISSAGAKEGGKGGWERVKADDSRWFRLNGERWPCKLENARYWLRMYRRV